MGNPLRDNGAKCLAYVSGLTDVQGERCDSKSTDQHNQCSSDTECVIYCCSFLPSLLTMQLLARSGSLRHLFAAACGIGDEGAVSIAHALAINRSLRTLDLRYVVDHRYVKLLYILLQYIRPKYLRLQYKRSVY